MTLTQTAELTKKVIAILSIMIVVGTLSFITYQVWHSYYIANLPLVEEKPTTAWGQLPPPDFPSSSVSSSNFSYSLDTSTGGLPKVGIDSGFDKILKVFFIVKSSATLLSPERSQTLAQKLNILTDPQIISETKYKFIQDNKTLSVDLDSGNFTYKNEATASTREALDTDDQMVTGFEQVLTTLGVLTDDLKKGRAKITLLKPDGNSLVPTLLRAEATAVQISLWPQDVDKKPIFTPGFNKALVNATVVKSAQDLENYLSIQFTNYPIDTSTVSTYPIKTPEVAYNDLKSGKGVVVLEPQKAQVSISSVYLGYYLSENYNPYLEPVFVFEGQNFVAYVAAIPDDFIAAGAR